MINTNIFFFFRKKPLSPMIPGNKNFSRIFRNDLYIFQDEMSIEINKARSLVNYGGEQQALLVSRQRERERTLKEIQLRRETGGWKGRRARNCTPFLFALKRMLIGVGVRVSPFAKCFAPGSGHTTLSAPSRECRAVNNTPIMHGG